MTKLRWLILPICLLLAIAAQAHGYVVRAIPADRSALERAPTRLQYFFSESLEPRFSEIHLRDQSGKILASGGVDQRNDALLTLPAPPNLPDGAYIVELRPAFASDGHVIAESRVFFVGEAVDGISGSAADQRAIPLEALWRAALNLANFLFFGATSLYALVLLPAWGNRRYAEGLPARVMRRLRAIVIAALLLAGMASLLALLQQSMVFFNASAEQVIAQNLWQVALIGSRFGDVWTFRVVLLLFGAALLFAASYFRDLFPQLTAGFWRGMPWLGALFIGLSMVTSHAAGSLLLPWLAIAVDWLHALAAAFWLGGLLSLTLLLPSALQPLDADGRQSALRTALGRFSRLVGPLLLLVILSGIYNALNFIAAPSELDSGYARTLAIKLLLVAPLILLGGWQRLSLRKGQLRGALRWLRLEALLMLVLLLAVAFLSATPLPEPALEQANIPAPQASQQVGDYQVTAAVIPGGPGVNSYDILIERGDDAEMEARVALQLVHPARDWRSDWQAADAVEAGLYVAAGDEIDRAGEWLLLADIVDSRGQVARAAFRWDISEQASVIATRPPNALHLGLLTAIAALLLHMVVPRLRGLLAALQVSSGSLLIALLAIAISAGVMVGGATLIAERQREYERTLNPPPALVNSVLPDAKSLAAGERMFHEHCAGWTGDSRDFESLRRRLDSSRDDFLYAALSKGWRSLPACAEDLLPAERWHVVNYLRTLATRE